MINYRGYADGMFGQVHYRVCAPEEGVGRPLLLCHQSPASQRQFDPVYALLAAGGIMAIGVDHPGFGNSDVPDRVPTIEDYADSVVSVLDALELPQADILGQHTGSMVAMEATLRHPQRFRRLVLNGPSPFTPAERKQWIDTLVARQKAWTLRADGQHLQELWDRRVRASPGWTSIPAMHRHVVQMLIAGDTLWYGHHASLVYDQQARLAKISHPCLALLNTGDAVYEVARRTFEIRPDFKRVILQGGTHDIVDEQPREWSAAVINFLNAEAPSGA
jgi:pimeloyl-ACP methyl ester carboxylesterase